MTCIIMGIINSPPMNIEFDPIAPCNDECKLKLNFGGKVWKKMSTHQTKISLERKVEMLH